MRDGAVRLQRRSPDVHVEQRAAGVLHAPRSARRCSRAPRRVHRACRT
jgi:hypothetical protein